MDELEGDIEDVTMRFEGDTCDCEVVCESAVESSSDVVHRRAVTCRNCPGAVFRDFGLVPRFRERNEGEFVVRTYLPQEHNLSELVDALREVSHEVEVLRLVQQTGDDECGCCVDVDLSQLTPKQEESLEVALSVGFYEVPREASLEDVAAELDISKSALARRLARTERQILNQLLQ